jgi:hypothetical protein
VTDEVDVIEAGAGSESKKEDDEKSEVKKDVSTEEKKNVLI